MIFTLLLHRVILTYLLPALAAIPATTAASVLLAPANALAVLTTLTPPL